MDGRDGYTYIYIYIYIHILRCANCDMNFHTPFIHPSNRVYLFFWPVPPHSQEINPPSFLPLLLSPPRRAPPIEPHMSRAPTYLECCNATCDEKTHFQNITGDGIEQVESLRCDQGDKVTGVERSGSESNSMATVHALR